MLRYIQDFLKIFFMHSNKPVHSSTTDSKDQDKRKDEKGHIREGQEDSAINDSDHIKHHSYPETALKDKQLDNQEEFITPPNKSDNNA
jgi:hypothetical protein